MEYDIALVIDILYRTFCPVVYLLFVENVGPHLDLDKYSVLSS